MNIDISDIILITADFVLLTMDEQGTITSSTPAVRKIFEKEEGQVEGVSFSELVSSVRKIETKEFKPVYPRGGLDFFGDDNDIPYSKCNYLEYLAFLQCEQKIFETKIEVNGKIKWIDISVSKLQDQTKNENKLYFTAIINDITQRKEAEEEIISLNQGLEKRVEERTAELMMKTDQVKKVVKSCNEELANVNDNYQEMKEKQMAVMEQIEAKIISEVPNLSDLQREALQKSFGDQLMKSMELYSQDQITDQKFLLTLRNLHDLFEKEPTEQEEDKLTPGQMSGTDQNDVDDLLASLGM